ncbi:MAG: hypothetical protein KF852_13180 [Saprospiraceae bacterium]|nr:hypothetical protein [Saprospiraceae bacterium]
MRYFIAFCMLISILTQSRLTAQTAQDAVYLTNQQFYQGIIIEQKPGEHIRLLRLPERDTLQFEMDDIDRIVKLLDSSAPLAGAATESTSALSALPERKFNRNKYVAMLHASIGGGKYALLGLGISVARSFEDRMQAGIGVQFIGQTSNNTFPNQQIIPVTADFRFKISESRGGRLATMAGLSAGYNISVDNKQFDSGFNADIRVTNGVFLNPSLAFRVNILRNMGLMMDFGYQFSSGNIYFIETGELYDRRTWHNFAARGTLFF